MWLVAVAGEGIRGRITHRSRDHGGNGENHDSKSKANKNSAATKETGCDLIDHQPDLTVFLFYLIFCARQKQPQLSLPGHESDRAFKTKTLVYHLNQLRRHQHQNATAARMDQSRRKDRVKRHTDCCSSSPFVLTRCLVNMRLCHWEVKESNAR